tara:strand:+ start:128 stop:466 length:339 start_codon:yes stop_codon:yes gene_type:complete
MKNFDYTINSGSGRYTNLDKEYNKFLETTLRGVKDDGIIYKWDTYNLIMTELLQLGRYELFNEIKYRLTDGENPNEVMIDILDRESNLSGFLWLIRKRIEEYINDDFENTFY